MWVYYVKFNIVFFLKFNLHLNMLFTTIIALVRTGDLFYWKRGILSQSSRLTTHLHFNSQTKIDVDVYGPQQLLTIRWTVCSFVSLIE
ncbi:unnamed protein product [Parnassius mnemosyne]|uniref:Uncharacterized protein n=1 Tax=Parnassius mnemosyne TaxID=213953 RepID=A0AAV1LH82_9NEOP